MSVQSEFIGPDFIEYQGYRWIEEADYHKMLERARQEAEQRGFDRGFKDGMTWRVGGPSAVVYWQTIALATARDAVVKAQHAAADINFCKDCADWSVAVIDAVSSKLAEDEAPSES